jgi:hypothetical protein
MTTLARSGQAAPAVARRLERVVRPRCWLGAGAGSAHALAGRLGVLAEEAVKSVPGF